MINIKKEKLMTLAQATEFLPPRRRGKAPSFSTILRWAQTGIHGHRLEVVRVGETLCTSVEAVQRFFDGCTAAAPPARPADPQREADYHAALDKLRDMGMNA